MAIGLKELNNRLNTIDAAALVPQTAPGPAPAAVQVAVALVVLVVAVVAVPVTVQVVEAVLLLVSVAVLRRVAVTVLAGHVLGRALTVARMAVRAVQLKPIMQQTDLGVGRKHS
ncbi:hypothetical protein SPFM15_00108 [Salmonella phage SPFM15]|nr:hypothetical protein SPFM5_00103 [Salmonella phage SPFM5]VFR13732.1 hypothetical protein SPFM15_00108 [Salmonella phage SPFM15]